MIVTPEWAALKAQDQFDALSRFVRQAGAIIPTVNAEMMEVGVGPAEGDPGGVMEGGELSLRTRSRRPIMGLIGRIQTWSR